MAISSENTSNRTSPHKADIIPLSLALLALGFIIGLGVFAPLLNGEGFNLIQTVYWIIPVPFLLLPIFKPKWTIACLIALIFWLPGPIDHFLEVRASFYETADKVRVVSLLDWVFFSALLLPGQIRSKLRQIDLIVLVLLFILSSFSVITIVSHTFTLDSARIPALYTGIIFFRFFIIFLITKNFINKPEDLHWVYLGLIAGAMGLIANSTIMYFRGASTGGRLVAGTFGNNIFAVLLSVMIIFAGTYKEVVKKPLLKSLLTGLQLVSLLFMILSGTRMAIALLILGWAILFFLRHKNPFRFFTQALLFAVIFMLAVGSLARFSSNLNITGTERVASLINIATGQASPAEFAYTFRTWIVRTVIWQFALERLSQNPWLGIGPGQWNYERTFATNSHIVSPNGINDSISDPHNGYIHLGLEYGWPTLILYGILLVVCLWKGWHSLRKLRKAYLQNEQPPLKHLFILFGGLFTSIVILLIGEITNAYITKIHLQLLISILLFSLLRAEKVLENSPTIPETVTNVSLD